MSVTLRRATEADCAATTLLWQQCGLCRPWNDPEKDFALALASPSCAIFLAEDEAALVGTIMVGFDGHRGWIYYLGTLPDRQGQGIARALLRAAEDWLRDMKCPKVELMVRNDSPAAGFYDHLGWEPQAVRVYARWLNNRDE